MARVLVITDTFDSYTNGAFPSALLDDLANGSTQLQVSKPASDGRLQNGFTGVIAEGRLKGTYADDQYVSIKLDGTLNAGNGDWCFGCTRMSADINPNRDYYSIGYYDDTGNIRVLLERVNNDTRTVLATLTTPTFATTDLLELETTNPDASTVRHRIYKNGTQIGSTVDDTSGSRISTGKPGVAHQKLGGVILISNLEAGNVIQVAGPLLFRRQQVFANDVIYQG